MTTHGLYVGMSVEEFLKKYSNTELKMPAESNTEYFAPDELQTYSADGKYDSCTVLFVRSNDKQFLGTGNFFDYPTSNYRKDGSIYLISIYKWK
jgi:hypothetical protein